MHSEQTLTEWILECLPYSCSEREPGFLKLCLSDGSILILEGAQCSSASLSLPTSEWRTSRPIYSWTDAEATPPDWETHFCVQCGSAEGCDAVAATPCEPIAWLDTRTAGDWKKRIVATNPQYVANNGPENFAPLYVGAAQAATPCPGCDGHECDDGCKYPGAKIEELNARIEKLESEVRMLKQYEMKDNRRR